MAKMLDVLEVFLNIHGHTYMRLDGSTKPETRQVGGGKAGKGTRGNP
jgi:E1A-binding protein p400